MEKTTIQINTKILNDKEIEEIKQALEEVRKGEVFPIEQVAKEFNVVLR